MSAEPLEDALQTVEQVERVEAELDSFVEKRAREAKDREEESEQWQSSVMRFHTKRYHANCEEWAQYHEEQARRLSVTNEALVSRHREQAAKYRRMIANGSVPQGNLGLRPGRGELW